MATERPILLSAPMVRAVLGRRKTQTRRVVKPQPANGCHYVMNGAHSAACHLATVAFANREWDRCYVPALPNTASHLVPCPYGRPGDRLWVREAWRAAVGLDGLNGSEIAKRALASGYDEPWAPMKFLADGRVAHGELMLAGVGEFGTEFGRYRHPRFMPRWASRITLEITDVRVQRLQDTSEQDAKAEGADPVEEEVSSHPSIQYRGAFHSLWSAIHGIESWNTNPWVWALTFTLVEVKY